MEGTESTARERTTGKDGNQTTDQKLLNTSKPLHRFVQREPKSLGIVLLMFGCAEVLMGFVLAQGSDQIRTSIAIYIPFWQGALFLTCGILSIYTEIHPSKKLATVCLAMYVVSLLGIIVSVGYRISLFTMYGHRWYMYHYYGYDEWTFYTRNQIFAIEGLLLTSSLCVLGLLIFLATVARLALKSTHTQVIIQHIPPPPRDVTPN
ncbi:uncharacterized protein LOC119494047 [Sebastes umbrosus]|uniref:uncharacterized protein LOC119494047 n=1 Tax=Sebastes umbrosus TaxID=72105 RepID=UPI00189FC0AF|nr:uncharacterized protein LOC119494047 [Sebastes umbrosus]